MNILAAIRREERKLEKQVGELRRQLEGLTAAAKVLGNSVGNRLDKAEKRVGRDHGGIVNPPRNRKGGSGNPPPESRRARALSRPSPDL